VSLNLAHPVYDVDSGRQRRIDARSPRGAS